MRTTVDIELPLLRRLRAEARRRGISFKALLQGILRRGLEERRPVGRYRMPTFSMGIPERGETLDKALALSALLEDHEVIRELTLRK
jgi:hypothetical protein